MPDATEPEADDSAEKAYAAAAEAVIAQAAPEPVKEPAKEPAAGADPVEFPPRARRGRKPRPVAAQEAVPETPVAETAPEKKDAAPKEKGRQPLASRGKPAKPRTVGKAAKAAAQKVKKAAKKQPIIKTPIIKTPITKTRTAPKSAATKTTIPPSFQTVSQKDRIMATKTKDFTEGFKEVIAEAQEKTKSALEKGTATIDELNEYAKGNVEALVESSKILAAGLQDLGTNAVAEGRSAFETLTADVKELASVKTPADLFKLQGELARRNFDNAVAFGSKSSEALLKLANEAMAPLSGRVSLVVEILKKAA